jgi:DNA-binding MarR family transcriptional regulator
MTSAEVAATLAMRKSSAHKHLTRLTDAGFVQRHEDERKWVYYSLTHPGRHLVETERPRLVLLLGTAVAALAASIGFLAWRVQSWRSIDGDGTWGVDEIFLRPRPEFFTAGVLAAILLTTFATVVASRIGWRLLRARESANAPADVPN